jgi:hypothetical protein
VIASGASTWTALAAAAVAERCASSGLIAEMTSWPAVGEASAAGQGKLESTLTTPLARG